MKYFFTLVGALLMTCSAVGQTEFKSKVSQEPIVVKCDKIERIEGSLEYSCFVGERKRLHIVPNSYGGFNVNLYNTQSDLLKVFRSYREEMNELVRYLNVQVMTPTCTTTFTTPRDFSKLEVKQDCDVLTEVYDDIETL